MNEITKVILSHDCEALREMAPRIEDYEAALQMDGARVVADCEMMILLIQRGTIDTHCAITDAILFGNRTLVRILRDDFHATIEPDEIARFYDIAQNETQREFILTSMREYGFLDEKGANQIKNEHK